MANKLAYNPVTAQLDLTYVPIVVNVKDYGATGDGATDDTTAIQTAMNTMTSGGTLWFPPGTYLYSADLVPLSNVRILGSGWGSILKAYPSLSNVANAIKLNNVTNVTISNLQINGNKANINQAGAGATYTQKQAIYITGGSTNINVNFVKVVSTFAGGIVFDNVDTIQVVACQADSCGDNAIFGRPSPNNPWTAPTNVEVYGNTVANGTYSGIGLIKVQNFLCFSNISHNNAPLGGTNGQGSGFTIEGCQYGTVSGNQVHDNGVNGIDVRYSNEGSGANVASAYITVSGNQSYNNGYGSGNGNAGGIVTEGVDNLLVQGNLSEHDENGLNYGAGNGLDPTNVKSQGNRVSGSNLVGVRFFTNGASVNLVSDGDTVKTTGSDCFTANCEVTVRSPEFGGPSGAGKENIHLLAGSSGSKIQGGQLLDPIDNCILIDNTVTGIKIRDCIMDKGAGAGGRGLYEANAAGAATELENCKFIGFTFQSFFFNNANSVARNCYTSQAGFYDHNSGSATVAATTTTITFNHNLYAAPTRVEITPTTDTQGKRWWVSAKTATQITISLDSAFAGAGITFDWRAWTWDV